MLPPAAIEPQFMVVRGVVQAESEYTPRLGVNVVIVPDEVTSFVTVMAAMVVTVNARATMAIVIANIFEVLCE